MRVAIIEDETLAARYLTRMLNETDEAIDVVAVLDSTEAAVSFLESKPPVDLIFMDIELGDGQSFDIYERVQTDIPVIFITAYEEHALKAFKLNSIDYLLKPVDKQELMNALEKYRKVHLPSTKVTGNVLEILKKIQAKHADTYRKRYLAKSGTRLISVDINEIAYFYIKDRMQFIKTKTDKDYIIDWRMDEIEPDIDPQQFFRVNRQFIIGYDTIKKVHTWFNGKLKVEVAPAAHEEIVIGRLRAGEFKKWLGE